ncbi:hypothetical protein [Myceligenerans pegani]|uniref:Uncharacterized protein n=1 Tax=Myceligenerans pegani TaxID=2776917 RepID=A0ABR9N5C5_9MICO|nr:hypothetical protein [Myceligenerans sp. TRM 65318]MBE1878864.1 hypothetical protein [Myceligenerans sp. TRM 65318]MBE3021135.1 hypothetical protein [Myceligenerans sp. TRM 65318]
MSEQNAMTFSEDDVQAARATLAQARDGEVVGVVILTDEEVAILDGLENEQLVPTPWMDAQTGGDRSLMGRVALRSMLSRELVQPVDTDDGSVKITAHPGITGPLVLRRSAQEILSVERTSSNGKDWLFAYVHIEGGRSTVLEEEISGSGHHVFSVYPAALLGERFEKFFDPTGTAAMSSSPKSYSAEAFESAVPRLPQLNEAVAVSIVSGVRRGSDTLLNASVYAGPHGVHVLRGSEHDGDGTPVTYTLQEVGPRGLRALPTEMIPA